MPRLSFPLLFAVALFIGCDCGPPQVTTPPPLEDYEPVAAQDFEQRLIDASCNAYRQCDNELFRGGVFHLFLLSVGSSFEDDLPLEIVEDSRKRYETIEEAVEARTPPTLPADKCEDFTELVTGFLGFRPAALTDQIEEGIVDFDEDAAGRCIERIANPPPLCDDSRQVSGERFNMQQYRAIASRHEDYLEQHYAPCTEILQGQRATDEECTYIYECDEGLCEWYAGADTGVCGPDRRTFWLVP